MRHRLIMQALEILESLAPVELYMRRMEGGRAGMMRCARWKKALPGRMDLGGVSTWEEAQEEQGGFALRLTGKGPRSSSTLVGHVICHALSGDVDYGRVFITQAFLYEKVMWARMKYTAFSSAWNLCEQGPNSQQDH